MQVSDGTELGARGAALSAGIGTGVYRDYAEAVEQAVSIVRVQEPIPAKHRYNRNVMLNTSGLSK